MYSIYDLSTADGICPKTSSHEVFSATVFLWDDRFLADIHGDTPIWTRLASVMWAVSIPMSEQTLVQTSRT